LFERPDTTRVSDFAAAGDTYLLSLAKRFDLDESATLEAVMGKMEGQFDHVAGYLTLKEAADAAEHCRCKFVPGKPRFCHNVYGTYGVPLSDNARGPEIELAVGASLTNVTRQLLLSCKLAWRAAARPQPPRAIPGSRHTSTAFVSDP
jgi:hypothetical protein